MVGAKSVGCLTCKRRKVKCDEKFPICGNCERGKRQCPGPKARFIRFIEPGNEQHMRGDAVPIILPKPLSFSQSESLATSLVARLEGIKETGYQLQAILQINYFSYLVSRIGHNPALDAAVKCVLGAHQNVFLGNESPCDKSLCHYALALSLIRKDMDKLRNATSAETVCACLLLCSYEFLNKDAPAWITHAGGAAALIESWGPDCINSEFELSLFNSHYGSCISTSIISGRDCFLTSPAWEAVRIKCLASKKIHDRWLSDLLAALATLPALLKKFRYQHFDPIFSPLKEAKLFKARILRVGDAIQQYLKTPDLVRESPSSYVPAHYEFSSSLVAGRYTLYWTTIIIANTILILHGDTDCSLMTESMSAADHICKSIPYFCRFKPLGTFPIELPLAVAFCISSTEQKRHIMAAQQELFGSRPEDIWRAKMELTFELMTGQRFV